MKKHILLQTVGLILSLAAPAFASGTVCSNAQLYYSNQRFDFGTQPPPGTVTGTLVVVLDGKVLLNHKSIAGMHVQGQPPYQLKLEGTPKVLSTSGVAAAGASVIEQTGVLSQVDPMHPEDQKEIARGSLVCRQTWAFPPGTIRKQ